MAVTAAQAVQALKDKKGFVSQAAKQLGISRRQLHRLIKAHPTIKDALDDAREEMKDFAESKIYQGIANENTALLIFYAKTQMKDRGYVERQEVTGPDGGPVEMENVSDTDLLKEINKLVETARTRTPDDPD
jgi:hypothetical protein